MHGDISRELEAAGQSDQAALDLWRQSFIDGHIGIGDAHPGRVYIASARKFERTPEVW